LSEDRERRVGGSYIYVSWRMFPAPPPSFIHGMKSLGVPGTHPWVTVETLAPDGMSAVSVGAESREFVGWQRVVQRLVSRMPSARGLTAARAFEAVVAARDGAADVRWQVRTDCGPYVLHARPVLGPAAEVHAVRLWAGPSGDRVPSPNPAAGGIWDLGSQTIRLPAGVTELAGMAAHDYQPSMAIAELFHRWKGFDRHGEVLDLLYDPKPGATLQFDVTVGFSARWRVSMRARDDARTRGAWLLIEDVSSADAVPQASALERVALREAHRRAGTHLGVVQVEHSSISHWLTDPAPWVRWDNLPVPVDVFHPEDRARLAGVAERLGSGAATALTVRSLSYSGDYAPTSLVLYPYPGYTGRQVAIAEFSQVDQAAPGPDGPVAVTERRRGKAATEFAW